MNEIPIYKAEASDENIVRQIKQSGSIAYCIPVNLATADNVERIKSIASIQSSIASKNDSDLYFLQSILVTTSWNKNDDVFTPYQTWSARHTPSHKPTNLEHDETQLVGHIVDCWAIAEDGVVIPDNATIEDLPEKFHLVTGSVLYKNWSNEDLQQRTANLIEQIEAGAKFVSMEVLFSDFDYAVQEEDGKWYTKARNQETAWITKHLRCYGGDGTYDGKKLGRVLKNLTFCGKGYVDKPANPDSIIFTNSLPSLKNVASFKPNGVLSLGEINPSIGDIKMSDENKNQEKIDSLNVEIVNLKVEKEQLTAKIAELTKAVEDSTKNVTDLTAKVAESEAKYTDLTKVLEDEKTSKAELQNQLETIKAAEVKANRISTLVDGGIDKEKATEKVDLFANLSDEQFTVVATELVNAVKAQVKEEEKIEEKVEETEANEETDTKEPTEDALDKVEATEEVSLNIEDEQKQEAENIRIELRNAVAARLGRTPKNKESDKEV